MIECPRCGFAQPKDQYCASCGVNMEQLLSKPKPFFVRLVQNPNLHLFLIVTLIVVVGVIVYTQSGMVTEEAGGIRDLPVSSRSAADPEADSTAGVDMAAAKATPPPTTQKAAAGEVSGAATGALAGDISAAPGAISGAVGAESRGATPQRLELTHWEIPRESLNTLLPSAQRLGESSGGRAYYWAQGAKVAETLQNSGQGLTAPRTTSNLQAGAQLLGETPPTAPEFFQYALLLQLTKFENKEASLRWDGNLVLPQPELAGETTPTMRSVLESNFSGTGNLAAQGLIMVVIEPPHRTPREEIVSRAGFGPWGVFASPEYRAGLTDWVIVFQLK